MTVGQVGAGSTAVGPRAAFGAPGGLVSNPKKDPDFPEPAQANEKPFSFHFNAKRDGASVDERLPERKTNQRGGAFGTGQDEEQPAVPPPGADTALTAAALDSTAHETARRIIEQGIGRTFFERGASDPSPDLAAPTSPPPATPENQPNPVENLRLIAATEATVPVNAQALTIRSTNVLNPDAAQPLLPGRMVASSSGKITQHYRDPTAPSRNQRSGKEVESVDQTTITASPMPRLLHEVSHEEKVITSFVSFTSSLNQILPFSNPSKVVSDTEALSEQSPEPKAEQANIPSTRSRPDSRLAHFGAPMGPQGNNPVNALSLPVSAANFSLRPTDTRGDEGVGSGSPSRRFSTGNPQTGGNGRSGTESTRTQKGLDSPEQSESQPTPPAAPSSKRNASASRENELGSSVRNGHSDSEKFSNRIALPAVRRSANDTADPASQTLPRQAESSPRAPAVLSPPSDVNNRAHASYSEQVRAVERVVELASLQKNADSNQMNVVLRDSQLGRISLRLVERNGLIDTLMRTDNSRTGQLIGESLPQMLESLSQKGFNVSHSGSEQWTGSQQDQRQGGRQRPPRPATRQGQRGPRAERVFRLAIDS